MTARRVLAAAWVLAIAAGLVGQGELIVLVSGYGFAILLAAISFRMMHQRPAEALSGNRRLAYFGTTSGMAAFAVVGFAARVAGIHASRIVVDAPLAAFFALVAVLTWRAIVVQSAGRAVLVTFVVLLAYIPLALSDAMAMWSDPNRLDGVVSFATMAILIGAGVLGLVTSVAFGEAPSVAVPEAFSRPRPR